MSQYSTDSVSAVDKLLSAWNYQFPITTDSGNGQSFPELCSPDVSTQFSRKTTLQFHAAESIDSSINTNTRIDDTETWRFPLEDNTVNDIPTSPVNTIIPCLSRSTSLPIGWTTSSSTELEAEIPWYLTSIPHPTPTFRTSISTEAAKKELQQLNRTARRREKNRNSQRDFRKRKEQYVRDLEKQYTDLQKRYDALVMSFCGKDDASLTETIQSSEDSGIWEFQDLINPVL